MTIDMSEFGPAVEKTPERDGVRAKYQRGFDFTVLEHSGLTLDVIREHLKPLFDLEPNLTPAGHRVTKRSLDVWFW